MVIEHAERFGLSQLHQLRGRVGRGAVVSVCVLLYQAPLSPSGRDRLRAMAETVLIRLAPKDTTGGSQTSSSALPVVAASSFWELNG